MRRLVGAAWVLIPALAVGVAGYHPLSAQQPLEISVVQLDASDREDVRLVLTVLDAAGRPIPLDAGPELSVTVDGASLPLTGAESATDARLGIGVVLGLDTSGSMAGQALESARFAAHAFIEDLLAADRVAVLSFADEVQVSQGFTADRTAADAAVEQLAAVGNTALYAAVVQAAEAASSSGQPRQAVLLLTDGTDYGGVSGIARGEALQRARELGVPFYTVALGERADTAFLGELAAVTGGRTFAAVSPAELEALYQGMAQLLRAQIVLHLDLSGLEAESVDVTVRAVYQGSVGVATVSVDLSVAPPPVTATAEPAAPLPAAAPEIELPSATATEEARVDPLPVVAALVTVAGAVAVASFLWWQWRRSRSPAGPAALQVDGDAPPQEPARAGPEVLAELLVRRPGAEPLAVPVGRAPVTLGADRRCTVPLSTGAGHLDLEQARIWLADGRFMFHDLARRSRSRIGGAAVGWAVLEDGDEIEIGDTRLTFRLRASSQPVREPSSA